MRKNKELEGSPGQDLPSGSDDSRPTMKSAPEIGEVLAHLYSLEMNAGISSFWDSGWHAWLGDDMNGRHSEADHETLRDAAAWLLADAERLVGVWQRQWVALERRAALASGG